MRKTKVFFISDHTAITVVTLGKSVLTQFSKLEFDFETIPFMNSREKAMDAYAKIMEFRKDNPEPPVVFTSITDPELCALIKESQAIVLDLFELYIPALEQALHESSDHALGKHHGKNDQQYGSRIDALNFALNSDDGINFKDYDRADLILVGVSRTGKTPTCLYLALQYGVYVSNYPITEEDLESTSFPKALRDYRDKIHGLTIDAQQLHRIRQERRPGSQYASLKQCQKEISATEEMFLRENVPFLDVTNFSIEEISSTILYVNRRERGRIQ